VKARLLVIVVGLGLSWVGIGVGPGAVAAAPLAPVAPAGQKPAASSGADADAGSVGPPAAGADAIDPAIFTTAIEDYYAGRYADAAAGFWGYVHFGDAAAEQYEWSQFFLAESLRALGMYHAAVQYYATVAKTRQRPEILPEALRRLETLARERPISEGLVYDDVIYDSDFGALPQELVDWVGYVQGLRDYQHEFVAWGGRHFAGIGGTSRYRLQADYVMAVHALAHQRDDAAVTMLGTIVGSKVDDPVTKNRAQLALARLLFDLERFPEAQAAYERVQQISLSFEQAQLLLEKAWTAYQGKDFRRAMGYLHALDAPSYERYFLPDAFLLRGLIFKELCHFIAAKRVVRAFNSRYGRTLAGLHARAPLASLERIVNGATQEGEIARRTAFMKTLANERLLVDRYDAAWEDTGLDKHLRRLYDLELREQRRAFERAFEGEADAVAKELLVADEQMRLLDYEIGLDIFKRLKISSARQTKEEALEVPYDSANVYYEFDDEYWSDELHSYEYFITNRCFDTAEVAP